MVYTVRPDNDLLDDIIRPFLMANANEPDAFKDKYNSDDETDDEIDNPGGVLLLAVSEMMSRARGYELIMYLARISNFTCCC